MLYFQSSVEAHTPPRAGFTYKLNYSFGLRNLEVLQVRRTKIANETTEHSAVKLGI
jgi:hypothetical protein